MGLFDNMKKKIDEQKKSKAKKAKKDKKKAQSQKAPKKDKPAPKVAKKSKVDDLLKRIDMSILYPPFAKKLKKTVEDCRKVGSDYFVISGLRTWPEQQKLYAQGRTKPGVKVTNAKKGESAHNYGVAGDGCKDRDMERKGLQPGWNLEEYECWAKSAEANGLESGMSWSTFKEGPHVQLPLKKHDLHWNELIPLYQSGGMKAVWEEFDKHDWDGEECKGCK